VYREVRILYRILNEPLCIGTQYLSTRSLEFVSEYHYGNISIIKSPTFEVSQFTT
jgi:hypothetical protein